MNEFSYLMKKKAALFKVVALPSVDNKKHSIVKRKFHVWAIFHYIFRMCY